MWSSLSPPVAAEGDAEPRRDLIHADLPIFTEYGDNVWPQGFVDEESWGCSSRVAFGDWQLHHSDDAQGEWLRHSNYGVFHCFALIQQAEEREELDTAPAQHSLFVQIGDAPGVDGPMELWVAQIGGRPGSDYLLLARTAGEGLIDRFTLLQAACPARNVRDAGAIDILQTRYCSINTKRELLALARRMARRPAVGVLIRTDDPVPEGGDAADVQP